MSANRPTYDMKDNPLSGVSDYSLNGFILKYSAVQYAHLGEMTENTLTDRQLQQNQTQMERYTDF